MALQSTLIFEIDAIVQLLELQKNLDDLGLVGARQAPVLLSAVYSPSALVEHLRAYWVRGQVPVRGEIRVLLRHKHHHLVLLFAARDRGAVDRLPDVLPDVGGVVPVQEDELLAAGKAWPSGCQAVAPDLREVLVVCLWPDDVDGLVLADSRVLTAVLLLVLGEKDVVRDPAESQSWRLCCVSWRIRVSFAARLNQVLALQGYRLDTLCRHENLEGLNCTRCDPPSFEARLFLTLYLLLYLLSGPVFHA